MDVLGALLDRWGQDEQRFRDYGQDAPANVLAQCRSDLSGWWREYQLETLTLDEAAAYSGLSAGTLGNKIRSGELANAGRKHAPRVRRCDIPMKALGRPDQAGLDLAGKIIRSQVE
jgi:hypothetical protein